MSRGVNFTGRLQIRRRPARESSCETGRVLDCRGCQKSGDGTPMGEGIRDPAAGSGRYADLRDDLGVLGFADRLEAHAAEERLRAAFSGLIDHVHMIDAA